MGVPPPGFTVSKMRDTAAESVMFWYESESRAFRKKMSIPSLSWAVHIGVMDLRASEVSRHERPAIDPESSIRKTVSKVDRNA